MDSEINDNIGVSNFYHPVTQAVTVHHIQFHNAREYSGEEFQMDGTYL
jgi:hypothetical protein